MEEPLWQDADRKLPVLARLMGVRDEEEGAAPADGGYRPGPALTDG